MPCLLTCLLVSFPGELIWIPKSTCLWQSFPATVFAPGNLQRTRSLPVTPDVIRCRYTGAKVSEIMLDEVFCNKERIKGVKVCRSSPSLVGVCAALLAGRRIQAKNHSFSRKAKEEREDLQEPRHRRVRSMPSMRLQLPRLYGIEAVKRYGALKGEHESNDALKEATASDPHSEDSGEKSVFEILADDL
eukprot:Skav215745  [mRNA]  locus=scaffold106:98746:102023:+ [translate_table: standard]